MSFDGMSAFADTQYRRKYAHGVNGTKENWPDTAERQARCVVHPYYPDLTSRVQQAIEDRKMIPGGRYLYAAGRPYPQVNNCFLFCAEDSRKGPGGWADTMGNVTSSLMTGGGVGVVYSPLRSNGRLIHGMGGNSSGPCALMKMVNEAGRYIIQGGSRRTAIWAGLIWYHPDIWEFIGLKDWSDEIKAIRSRDFKFPAPMDGTNISVILDDDFFTAFETPGWSKTYKDGDTDYVVTHDWAVSVYWAVIRHMVETGEPGFSVDIGANRRHNLRNACTEVTSDTNLDMCNLLSLNLARINSLEELAELTDIGIAFLLCGTMYSVLPVDRMYAIREKNRRLGLGLMGVHEWLLKRGYRYGPNPELEQWMNVYRSSSQFARERAGRLSISCPVATRSIAPTGTISIVGETTSGIEPIFAVAYLRRYLDGPDWKAQYVVDATAKRLIDSGVDPELIEDAYTLAEDITRRVEFQAWMQQFVDHGISSTINLPPWGTSLNNESTVEAFGKSLLPVLPRIRGITAYPDGSRGGQPLNRVSYQEAIRHVGIEFVETGDQSCLGGFCNS